MTDGIIKINSGRGVKLGFTTDCFTPDSYLWKVKNEILISLISSRYPGSGNVRALFDRIEDQGFDIFIPTPLGRMHNLCQKRGMKYTHRGVGPDYVEGYSSIKTKKMVRAKFRCTEVAKRTGWGNAEFLYAAKFSPVTGGSEENKAFFEATPSGSIEVSTVKEDHFVVGKSYYVDFTETE